MTISTRLTQNLLLGAAIVVLVAGIFWGFVAGSRAGKSVIILKNASAITDGLKLFLADQNRYPSTQEFVNKDIMLGYFNVFPFADITGGGCSKSFSYYSSNPKSYQLSFCLPKAHSVFPGGVSQVSNP